MQETQAMAPMPQYQSHKKVWALKIASVEYVGTDTTTDENPIVELTFEDSSFAPKKINLYGKPTPQAGWYYVQYEEGYESFSPPEPFEKGYTPIKPGDNPHGQWHGIGWAIKMMQDGMRVRRAGWNGKGMWLSLQVPDANSKMTLPYVYIEYPEGHPAYPNGSRVPWLASQTDLLSVDWELVG